MDLDTFRATALAGREDGPVYLDHAWRGPVPVTSQAVSIDAVRSAGRGRVDVDRQRRSIARVRAQLASLLLPAAWPADSLAFTQNTTAGVACLAAAVPWEPGDRVLVHADEVLGNLLPWRSLARRGVTVEVLSSRGGRLEIEDLRAAATPKACAARGPVRLVSIAAVSLPTGERRDLDAVEAVLVQVGARSGSRPLLVLDVAQALGALDLDLSGADALVGCGRKWLLGPPTVGLLAVRPGLLESPGWTVPTAGEGSLEAPADEGSWRRGAVRLEGGALPSPLIEGLGASSALLESVGLAQIERQVLRLASWVRAGATELGLKVSDPPGSAGGSGIVYVELPVQLDSALRARALEQALLDLGVVVRVRTGSPARLRVSAHAWNNEADVAALVRALRTRGLGRASAFLPG